MTKKLIIIDSPDCCPQRASVKDLVINGKHNLICGEVCLLKIQSSDFYKVEDYLCESKIDFPSDCPLKDVKE